MLVCREYVVGVLVGCIGDGGWSMDQLLDGVLFVFS